MVHTTLTTALPRCPRVVLSSRLSKASSARRLSTSNQNSLAGLRTRCSNNLEHFSESGPLWRRYGSMSATEARPRMGQEWNEVEEQAEEELATQENTEPSGGSSRRLKSDLRALLRDIAQPVAVVTSFMPSSEFHTLPSQTRAGQNRSLNGSLYHGATLSSFTSIAMDPYPLVSFALRIPSRMASALSSLSSSSSSPSSAHMVINLLSSSQASTALTFSRPDLYPTPFLGSSSSDAVPYTLSQDGLPILNDVIGALSCQLVGVPIPLHDLDYLSGENDNPPSTSAPVLRPGEVASELFIARVVRVEEIRREDIGELREEEDERTLEPLIYHRRGYTSCKTDS